MSRSAALRPAPIEEASGLEVSGLSLRYGQHRALDDVSLEIRHGEVVAIVGADGAGKSSLLEAICGLVPVNSRSQVCLDGRLITNLPPYRIVEAGLALVPEGGGCFGRLTVEENLLLGTYPARVRDGSARQRELIYGLFPELTARRRQPVNTLTEGERQMTAIGRALMSDPDCLMLDQPSLGLTPGIVAELFSAIGHLREQGMAILVTERDVRACSAIADRIYLMDEGRIVGADNADAPGLGGSVHHALSGMKKKRG